MLQYTQCEIKKNIEWAEFNGSVYVFLPLTHEGEIPALEFLVEECGYNPESLDYIEHETIPSRFIFHIKGEENE